MTTARDESDLAQVFDSNTPMYRRLCEEVEFALKAGIDASKIKTHTLTSRVKGRKAFLEKVERKGYKRPFEDNEDFVGIRIVCLFRSDLPRLRELISSSFRVLKEEDRVDGGDSESFGYMSIHFVCALKDEDHGPRYDGLHGQAFEIQCRTILMDAWANVSHYLAYKGDASIPEPLRRDFHALAGLFYVADKHFELFFGQSKDSQAESAGTVAAADSVPLALNRDTLGALLVEVYGRARSLDLDNVDDLDAVSTLVEELDAVGYTTVDAVRRDLEAAKEAAIAYESDHPPLAEGSRRFAAVGIARTAIAIANERYAAMKYKGDRHGKYTHLLGV